MPFNKKTSKGTSLNFYDQFAGNDLKTNSGHSAVNSKGQSFDNSTPLDWPYQGYPTDNNNNPESNTGFARQLSRTKTAQTDFKNGSQT